MVDHTGVLKTNKRQRAGSAHHTRPINKISLLVGLALSFYTILKMFHTCKVHATSYLLSSYWLFRSIGSSSSGLSEKTWQEENGGVGVHGNMGNGVNVHGNMRDEVNVHGKMRNKVNVNGLLLFRHTRAGI